MKFRAIIYVVFFFLLVSSCTETSTEKTPTTPDEIVCTAEDTTIVDGKPVFQEGTSNFSNANLITSELAYSGDKSIKLDRFHKYGMGIAISDVRPDQAFDVTVKRNGGDGVIAMKADVGTEYYVNGGDVVEELEDGWKLVRFQIKAPPHLRKNEVHFFLQHKGVTATYFDDFTIKKTSSIEYPTYNPSSAIHISLAESEQHKLSVYRSVAFRKGVIPKEVKKYVKARISFDTVSTGGKIRLKGEWMDHLQGDKWSFRVKAKNNGYSQSPVFSLHTPVARNFLKEYVAHKVFEKEGLLTTTYEFVPVYLNEKSLGVYAFEEHFDPKFGKRKEKPTGVVLRWDEEGFWEAQKIRLKGDTTAFYHPSFKAAHVSTFSSKKVFKKPELKTMFDKGSKLLYEWRDDELATGEVFCVDQLAKFTALVDLFGTYHGAVWHNMRYYYNSDSAKIEPILFDGYSDGWSGVYTWFERRFIGDLEKVSYKGGFNNYSLTKVFNDQQFRARYTHYVEKYTDRHYLDSIFETLRPKIEEYEKMITKEFYGYEYDRTFIYKRAEKLRQLITSQATLYQQFHLPLRAYRSNSCIYPVIPGQSVKVYTQESNKETKKILLINHYCKNMEVYDDQKWIFIPAGSNNRKTTEIAINTTHLQMRVAGTTKIFDVEVLPYKR